MPDFIDNTGQIISLTSNPSKIISLVPSLTELLCDLGIDEDVVGITKFCVHPKSWFSKKIKVGGTKNLDIQRIHELQPDLIIASKEENVKTQIEELSVSYPVWISDIHNVAEALKAIEEIGLLTGKIECARELISSITAKFSQLKTVNPKPKVIYLIWRDPYMTVGGDTFISSMLEAAGFENVYKKEHRYPSVTIREMAAQKPDYIFLSSEPFPFKEKHVLEITKELPGEKVVLVDGEMFSWYGSRMLYAPSYFLNLWTYGLHGK